MHSCLVMDPLGDVRDIVVPVLKRLGLRVQCASTAHAIATGQDIDMVLLDMRRCMHFTEEFSTSMRDLGRAVVVGFMEPRDAVDRVLALELGADAIIVPPYDDQQIAACLAALVRRAKRQPRGQAGVSLDLVKRRLNLPSGHSVALAEGEALVLAQLLQRPNQPISRGQMLAASGTLGQVRRSVHTIDVIVSRIRKKLEDAGCQQSAIQTLRGAGYVWLESVYPVCKVATDMAQERAAH